MTLKFHHTNAQVPQDTLGVYTYLFVRETIHTSNPGCYCSRHCTSDDVFTLGSKVHDLRCMVPQLYAGNRKLGSTLWTDNLGTGLDLYTFWHPDITSCDCVCGLCVWDIVIICGYCGMQLLCGVMCVKIPEVPEMPEVGRGRGWVWECGDGRARRGRVGIVGMFGGEYI